MSESGLGCVEGKHQRANGLLQEEEGSPKKDPATPVIKPTKYYDGFDGFTFPGPRPARNPHIDREDDYEW